MTNATLTFFHVGDTEPIVARDGLRVGDFWFDKITPALKRCSTINPVTWSTEINMVAGSGDMLKATYDPDADGDIAEAQLQLNYPTHAQNTDSDLDATFEASLKNTDNHTSGSTNKVYTATEQTKLAGIAAGAQVNNISDVNATDLTDGGATTLHSHAGGSGDMTKAVYDPNDDGVIATAQIAMAAIYLLVYPIGCIYQSVVSTSPATLFGGTWAALGAGRVLIGIDAADTDFDVAEETGGAKTVQSSAQTFGGSALASHQHAAITAGTPAGTVAAISATATAAVKIGTGASSAAAQTHTHSAPAFTGAELGTHQHNGITAGTPAGTNTPGAATSVVQPFLVCYRWKRTA